MEFEGDLSLNNTTFMVVHSDDHDMASPADTIMCDIMEFAHSFPAQKAYIIDMPRGMKKDKLADFYAGLESIKNGVTYDKRYVGKKRRMDRPQIMVFTNSLPVAPVAPITNACKFPIFLACA